MARTSERILLYDERSVWKLMIIHEFYIIAWYALWMYFLLCICVKLFADNRKNKSISRNQRYIRKFFLVYIDQMDPKSAKRILKYSRNDILFDDICECYFAQRDSEVFESVRFEIDGLMIRIFEQKLRSLPEKDLLLRYLLLNNIHRSGFELKRFEDSLPEYMKRAKSEQVWGDICGEKVTSLHGRQGDFENAYFS